MALKAEDKQQLDRLFLKSLMHRGAPEVTDEELAYFRERLERLQRRTCSGSCWTGSRRTPASGALKSGRGSVTEAKPNV